MSAYGVDKKKETKIVSEISLFVWSNQYIKTWLCWKQTVSQFRQLINRTSAHEVRDITNVGVIFSRQLFVFHLCCNVACLSRLTLPLPKAITNRVGVSKILKAEKPMYTTLINICSVVAAWGNNKWQKKHLVGRSLSHLNVVCGTNLTVFRHKSWGKMTG